MKRIGDEVEAFMAEAKAILKKNGIDLDAADDGPSPEEKTSAFRRELLVKARQCRYNASEMPDRYLAPIAAWRNIPGTAEMRRAAAAYMADLDVNVKAGKNLVIVGKTPGTAKSHTVAEVVCRALDVGYKCRYIDDVTLERLLSQSSFQGEQERDWEIERLGEYWDVLMIDDAGSARYTEKSMASFGGIINARYAAGLATFLTANFERFDGVADFYGARVSSRLFGNAEAAENTSTVDART